MLIEVYIGDDIISGIALKFLSKLKKKSIDEVAVAKS